jgi:hypothetical protein
MNFLVIPVFIEVLRGTIANLGMALRISWPWLLLLVPLQVAFSLYETRGMSSAPQDVALVPHLVSTAYWLAAMLAGASIAVNWHRFLLLDEEATDWLRLDRPVWRYMWNGVLLILLMIPLFIIFFIPLFIFTDAVPPGGEPVRPSLFFVLETLLAMIVPMAILQRLSLKFPAIALGRDDYGFRDGWRDTRGNFLRIIGFTLLSSAASAPMTILLMLWRPDMQENLAAALLYAVLSTAWTLFMALFAINTLTVFYAIFVEGREA